MPIRKKEIKFEQPSELLLLANRYFVLILFVLLAGVFALSYFFLLNPKLDDISQVREQDIETEERRVQNEKLLTRIRELEEEYLSIRSSRAQDLEKIKKILPEEPQIAELFVIADRLAARHLFTLTSINISDRGSAASTEPDRAEVGQDAPLKSLVVHLSLARPLDITGLPEQESPDIYQDFKDYVEDLQSNLRLMDIQTISFGELTSGSSIASFNLDLITYYR
ncbi:MAG: hypothetical protein PHO91_02580 [Patescibacteria group bacterium]|nr:hypothetical protein [Patescibacteria group bacterium]